jgi:hypothetical protein
MADAARESATKRSPQIPLTRHRLETEFMLPPVDADETSDAALTVYYGISGGR